MGRHAPPAPAELRVSSRRSEPLWSRIASAVSVAATLAALIVGPWAMTRAQHTAPDDGCTLVPARGIYQC